MQSWISANYSKKLKMIHVTDHHYQVTTSSNLKLHLHRSNILGSQYIKICGEHKNTYTIEATEKEKRERMSHWERIREQLPVLIKYKLNFCLVKGNSNVRLNLQSTCQGCITGLTQRLPATRVSSEHSLDGIIPIICNLRPKQDRIYIGGGEHWGGGGYDCGSVGINLHLKYPYGNCKFLYTSMKQYSIMS